MFTSRLSMDVFLDILSRLPVKSLARFKCAKKAWHTLIESPSFIAQHLCQSMSRSDNNSLLVKHTNPETRRHLVTLHPRLVPDNFMDAYLPIFLENGLMLEVFSVCANGIVCLYDHNGGFILWNPALREFRVLPVPPIIAPPKLDPFDYSFGFGYDVRAKDYKVVWITRSYDHRDRDPPALVQVYSLKTGYWKKVESNLDDDIHNTMGTHTFVNGAYHWLYGSGGDVILAFDISEEVFREVQLPNLCHVIDRIIKYIAVLNGSIALIVHPLDKLEIPFEIWVMKNYGLRETWTKMFTIGPIVGIAMPLGFWNDEKLVLETLSGDIIACDLITQDLKNVGVSGVHMGVLNYNESLVSVKGDN